jgi:hypothetical protein
MQVARERKPQLYAAVTQSACHLGKKPRHNKEKQAENVVAVGGTATNSVTTDSLRARRNPLPITRLPWMMCPPLCASKIIIVS